MSSYYDEIGWRGSVDLDGAALMNQGIHTVHLMRWLFGEVTTVQGQIATRVRDIEADDTPAACLRFASGGFGVISATTARTPRLPARSTSSSNRAASASPMTGSCAGRFRASIGPSLRYDFGSGSQAAKKITAIGHTRQWDHIMAALSETADPPSPEETH